MHGPVQLLTYDELCNLSKNLNKNAQTGKHEQHQFIVEYEKGDR